MRSISVLLVYIGICSGCKEDVEVANPLTGTWRIVDTYTIDDLIVKNYGGNLPDTLYWYVTNWFKSSDFKYTFSEHPNEVSSEGELQYWNFVRYPGLEETHIISVFGLSAIATWDIQKDTLLLTYPNGQTKRIIEELTGTTMRLREDVDRFSTYGEGILHHIGAVYTVFERE